MFTVQIKRRLPLASNVFDTYWKFAAERQEIFYNKIHDKNRLTDDPILLKYKFTNAYRASDRVSQYLIKNVIYSDKQDPNEVLFRILLFKTFNKIETWELLKDELTNLTWENYSFNTYSKILNEALVANEAIYSGAYIMASGKSIYGYMRKHENHLKLIEQMIKSNLANQLQEATSMEQVYSKLLSFPTIGPFLAYQYSIDINYSNLTNFSENDFVFPGPGAKDGIKKCFLDYGDYADADIIKYVTDIQEREFERLGISFKNLWGRSLQLIDCQNIFCETDKYSRVAHPEVTSISNRKRIKQLYANKKSYIEYYYPPKWNLVVNSKKDEKKDINIPSITM